MSALVTVVQTCALPISSAERIAARRGRLGVVALTGAWGGHCTARGGRYRLSRVSCPRRRGRAASFVPTSLLPFTGEGARRADEGRERSEACFRPGSGGEAQEQLASLEIGRATGWERVSQDG